MEAVNNLGVGVNIYSRNRARYQTTQTKVLILHQQLQLKNKTNRVPHMKIWPQELRAQDRMNKTTLYLPPDSTPPKRMPLKLQVLLTDDISDVSLKKANESVITSTRYAQGIPNTLPYLEVSYLELPLHLCAPTELVAQTTRYHRTTKNKSRLTVHEEDEQEVIGVQNRRHAVPLRWVSNTSRTMSHSNALANRSSLRL